MTRGLGQYKTLKEARVEISPKGEITGFLDLVGKNRILLNGKVEYFNDLLLEEQPPTQKFPIVIHFKIINPYKENDDLQKELGQEITVKEYLKNFNGNQTIGKRISIATDGYFLRTETSSQPYGDFWRFGAELKKMEILEAKNVPGLKDAEKVENNGK